MDFELEVDLAADDGPKAARDAVGVAAICAAVGPEAECSVA